MPLDEEEFDAAEEEFTEFVPVVVARSVDEAEAYRELLDEHDIPAIVGTEQEEAGPKRSRRQRGPRGIPVMVPEALLDEASEIIAQSQGREEDEFESEEGLVGAGPEHEEAEEDDQEADVEEDQEEEDEEEAEEMELLEDDEFLEEPEEETEEGEDLDEEDLEEEL